MASPSTPNELPIVDNFTVTRKNNKQVQLQFP